MQCSIFRFKNVQNEDKSLELVPGSLCFTYCQVPVIYQLGDSKSIQIYFSDNGSETSKELHLEKDLSNEIFDRTGKVEKLVVTIQEDNIA